jgi:LytS/YehU family sensor histidine kinase
MNVLVPRLLSKKKVMAYIGVTLFCFFLLCFALPSLIMQFHDFTRPPDMPFPHRPFDVFPPQDVSPLHGMISRWRLYNMRLHNPTTQFLLVFIISAGLKVITQWYREKQQLLELEKSRVQAELSFLKSQIHPHFLFNCLNSIYYLTLSKDDKAPKTILSLSDFLRFVFTESDSPFISMEKEITMLEEYLNLQILRTSEKFELQFIKDGNFEEYSIMPLTFIPFVENAFKYGLSAHTNCFVHIRIAMENGWLNFSCDNSVMPVVKDQARSSGVGLKNIRKRLELAYPDRYSLEIDEDSTGYHVKLQIDMI